MVKEEENQELLEAVLRETWKMLHRGVIRFIGRFWEPPAKAAADCARLFCGSSF
jgi:hypothetical protein